VNEEPGISSHFLSFAVQTINRLIARALKSASESIPCSALQPAPIPAHENETDPTLHDKKEDTLQRLHPAPAMNHFLLENTALGPRIAVINRF